MPYAKRTINLTAKQREYLVDFISRGVRLEQTVKRARILLESDISGGRIPPKELAIAEMVSLKFPSQL